MNMFIVILLKFNIRIISDPVDPIISFVKDELSDKTLEKVPVELDWSYNTDDWIVEADSEINRTESEIKKIEKMFELSNSYTLSDAYGYASTIEEYNELIERIKGVKAIFDFMKDILDEYKYGYEEDLDVSNILYFGMEISNPTVDDIR